MAIMKTSDWHRLIGLCKNEVKNKKGDKRAARGLLFRLTFYISENRLIHPQRRKQEPPIQTLMFDRASRGEPLSPKEVDLKTKIYDHTILGPGPYRPIDFGHPDCPVCEEARKNVPHDDIQLSGPAECPTEKEDQERPYHDGQIDTDTTKPPEPTRIPGREEAGEISQCPSRGGRDQIQIEERGEEIPRAIDEGKGWPDLEP